MADSGLDYLRAQLTAKAPEPPPAVVPVPVTPAPADTGLDYLRKQITPAPAESTATQTPAARPAPTPASAPKAAPLDLSAILSLAGKPWADAASAAGGAVHSGLDLIGKLTRGAEMGLDRVMDPQVHSDEPSNAAEALVGGFGLPGLPGAQIESALSGAAGKYGAAVQRANADAAASRIAVPGKAKVSVGARAAQLVKDEPEAMTAEYLKQNGNLVNPDAARELFPGYGVSNETRSMHAAAVHEPASDLARMAYQKLLSEPLAPGKRPTVAFFAGGGGSGKSTIAEDVFPGIKSESRAVVDRTLSNTASAIRDIDAALDGGNGVHIVYVHTPPDIAFGRVMKRAASGGRTVPISAFAKAHAEAPKTLLELSQKYADNPNVRIDVINNAGTRDQASLGSISMVGGGPNAAEIEEGARKQLAAQADLPLAAVRGLAGSGEQVPRGPDGSGITGRNPALGGQGRPTPGVGETKTTDVAKQFPGASEIIQQVQQDPAYRQRIESLGGGRVVANKETIAEASRLGAMHPDEIANWQANTPVSAVQAARGAMTMDWHEQGFAKALAEGNETLADTHASALTHMTPGYENLIAEPGRATQIQSTFATDALTKAFRELKALKASGLPFDQVQTRAKQIVDGITGDTKIKGVLDRVKGAVNGIETYATWAKLTSPMTHFFNTVSNALTFGTIRPIEKAGQAAALLAQGNREGAIATARTAFGTTEGFISGARKYVTELLADHPGDFSKAEIPKGSYEAPAWTRPLNPFRQLGAADAFWKAIIQDSHLHAKALESGLKQGLKGDALAARVAELVNKPPEPWLKAAINEAKDVTFQADPDAVLSKIAGLQHVPGMRLLIPFVKTPYNIAKYQAERSALGALMPSNVRGLAAGGEAQAQAVGRLSAGVALSTAAWMLVKNGSVTGAMPMDPKQQALWRAKNLQPYSIQVGDKRITYNRFSPLGQYLTQAAAVEDAVQSGGNFPSAMQQLVFSSIKGLMDMPFLQSTKELTDAVSDPQHSGTKFTAGVATGFIPNALRDVRYQTDATRRDARGIGPSLQNALPGLSSDLPEQVDVMGRTQKYEKDRLARASKFVTTPNETPETKIMDATGWSPTASSPSFRIGKKTVKLDRSDEAAFHKEAGQAGMATIVPTASQPGFKDADEEQKVEMLDRAWKRAVDSVRSRWKSKLRAGQSASPVAK